MKAVDIFKVGNVFTVMINKSVQAQRSKRVREVAAFASLRSYRHISLPTFKISTTFIFQPLRYLQFSALLQLSSL